MSLSETRARVKSRIWQAVAQSGVDLSSLPKENLDKLVESISEEILREMDDLLGQAAPAPAAWAGSDEAEAETVLWEGRPFLSLSFYYQITSERVRITEGMLGKQRSEIELIRIQDIDHKQNLIERTLGLGDLFIRSHDVSDPELTLNNISNPAEVHEILRRAVKQARKNHNMSFREEM